MLAKIAIGILAIFIWSGALAADDHKTALAKELTDVLDVRNLFDQTYSTLGEQLDKTIPANTTPEQKPIIEKYHQQLMALIKEEMGWDKVGSQIIDLYAQTFTENELQELIDFYHSELGQKLIKKMPELMQASMTMVQKQMAEMQPKMQAVLKEMNQELAKH
ncbi:MAG: DUF2059 domain-containing protein [Candidatus Thiothrix singaporensis]|uniref:DUF2059 domain-containing protein n=1 Tax=Candidatus Thiothrix singaporensis TaxID=2799669 RepID=A0A7L6AXH7_9GAMM|nr:MAG: DUF2059 domain-containing protein [Candidatus Thiothrix singaporensis]